MKNYTSSTVGSIDQRLKLDALGHLFSRLATTLGNSMYGTDQTKNIINSLPTCNHSDRPNLIISYWGQNGLNAVQHLLSQIELLESNLRAKQE